MITLKLLCWLAYVAVDVWTNFVIIERNRSRPNYLLLNIIRGMAFIVWGAFIVDFQYDIFYLNYFLFAITSFWIGFDLVLNIVRKKHPLYIGSNSGWIDQFGAKNRGVYYLAKVFALVVLVSSIINIYNP